MKTAAKPRIDRTVAEIREQTDSLSPQGVDMENCVVRGVKILGLVSDNGRVYTKECAADAVERGLYENIPFRRNHRSKESRDDRDVDDTVGVLRNARQDNQGNIYGDLHLLKTHELTPKILEAAQRELANKDDRFFGLSHDADRAERRFEDGVEVITRLERVRSVDLVADPATNKGLFESKGRKVKLTKKSLWESCWKRFDGDRRAKVKKLFEAMDEYGSAEVPDMEADDPEKMSPDDHLAKGMKEACHSVIEAEDMSADEKHQKIKEILKAHEKLMGGDKEEESEEPEVDDGEDSDSAESRKEIRKLQQELTEMKAQAHCRRLCESAKIANPSDTLLEALCALSSDEKRKALLKEQRQQAGTYGPRTQTGYGSGVTESRGSGSPVDISTIRGDGKAFGEALKQKRFRIN